MRQLRFLPWPFSVSFLSFCFMEVAMTGYYGGGPFCEELFCCIDVFFNDVFIIVFVLSTTTLGSRTIVESITVNVQTYFSVDE